LVIEVDGLDGGVQTQRDAFGPEHARELIGLLRGWKCHVNLIPLSPVAEFAGEAPDAHDCEGFLNALESARIATTLRRSRGRQADAACGQLRLRAQAGNSE
jgi:23S rRNA (adenine2503-C2)-methyltransferase